ncbi:uncharacterized protein K460DRAFT_391523 [Cucurbitaria berberidis CBS 394.84]|uniref:Secreted protein n=1 Tax=Cucurbitaria berberidis CBS 394.84 TaxID=1168544 RepID=A0A9P4GRD0_9PLEO|nr:uncharacterized protein K460DRAFT_391523 [Cucurbitaria berberidis CBS 394.84]KAF1851188.1 hypothetical protein K460DRAFT_391523 [Cucurbitaria berberidis CBS 394.84]
MHGHPITLVIHLILKNLLYLFRPCLCNRIRHVLPRRTKAPQLKSYSHQHMGPVFAIWLRHIRLPGIAAKLFSVIE